MIYLCSCNTVLHVTWYILWRLCNFIKSSQAQKQCFQTYQSWPPFSKYPFSNVCPLVAGVGVFVCSVHHFILLLPPNWLWLSQRCVTKEVEILVWKVCFIKALLSRYPFFGILRDKCWNECPIFYFPNHWSPKMWKPKFLLSSYFV